MTNTLNGRHDRTINARRRLLWVASALVAPLLMMIFASGAQAIKAEQKAEFLPFADCPLPQAGAGLCLLSTTTGGEFVIGKKTVPITKPILLQGGLERNSLREQQPLLAAADGNTLAKVPQEVPGGLVGIGGLGGEVTATAELAGPVSSVLVEPGAIALGGTNYPGPGVVLPIKVKLSNELLGENCYIGSDTEPVVLHLTQIHGSELEFGGDFKITKDPSVTLSDTTLAVPAAKGCGSGSDEELIDTLVNFDVGLPSESGKNSVTMINTLEQTPGEFAKKYLPKKKKEKKEKPKK